VRQRLPFSSLVGRRRTTAAPPSAKASIPPAHAHTPHTTHPPSTRPAHGLPALVGSARNFPIPSAILTPSTLLQSQPPRRRTCSPVASPRSDRLGLCSHAFPFVGFVLTLARPLPLLQTLARPPEWRTPAVRPPANSAAHPQQHSYSFPPTTRFLPSYTHTHAHRSFVSSPSRSGPLRIQTTTNTTHPPSGTLRPYHSPPAPAAPVLPQNCQPRSECAHTGLLLHNHNTFHTPTEGNKVTAVIHTSPWHGCRRCSRPQWRFCHCPRR
jgi:hypothetical protein